MENILKKISAELEEFGENKWDEIMRFDEISWILPQPNKNKTYFVSKK